MEQRQERGEMEQGQERVIIETRRHRLVGSLALRPAGEPVGLLDFLNSCELEFLALTQVSVESLDAPGPPEQRDFVAVARRHVVLATPADEAIES